MFLPLTQEWRSGLSAGTMSLASYWVAVWAFTVAPIALVAALRETSVLFALLIATFLLKEQAGLRRWTASILILFGIATMRL